MKLYRIEVAAFGVYWEYDVNAPLDWIGSGVYDVMHECHQEAWFEVAAYELEDALQLIAQEFSKHSDYSINFTSIWYAPSTVEETDYEDEEREPPFFADWGYKEPVEGQDAPEKYDKEI